MDHWPVSERRLSNKHPQKATGSRVRQAPWLSIHQLSWREFTTACGRLVKHNLVSARSRHREGIADTQVCCAGDLFTSAPQALDPAVWWPAPMRHLQSRNPAVLLPSLGRLT